MQQGVHSNPAVKKGKTIGNFLKNAKYAPQPTANFLKIALRPSTLTVVGGGGYYFFRIHVKGVIEYFCDAGGGAGHFVQLLIVFCQPTPGHKS
jgi:hypothetical protein